MRRMPPCPRIAPWIALAMLTALTVWPASAAYAQLPAITIHNRGEYRSTIKGVARDVTGTPLNNQSDAIFKKDSREIVARPGVSFGMRFTISGSRKNYRIVHRIIPPAPMIYTLTNKRSERIDITYFLKNNATIHAGVTLDELDGALAGTWIQQLLYHGNVLAEERFEVTVPENFRDNGKTAP